MKFFLSILLLLTTALYVLPVKEMITGKYTICTTAFDKSEDEGNKKEKAKELFSFSNTCIIIKESYSCTRSYVSATIPLMLYTIETPPPDVA
jgi:hypothetical protein